MNLTDQQTDTLRRLCEQRALTFDPDHYQPQFDLPPGYVAGWIGGDTGTIYVGVSPEGDASS